MSVDNRSDITITNLKWGKETEYTNKDDVLDEIDPELKTKLHIIAKRESFNTYKINVKNISTNGGNYFGTLNEVAINGQTKEGIKELNLFVKSAIYGEGLGNMLDVIRLYSNEIYFYDELSKMLAKLQDEADIPSEEQYNFVRCYEESNRDHVIMENLTFKGFEMMSRREIATFNFAKKSFEELAKFHALSFVLQKKEPAYFDKKIKSMRYVVNFNEEWEQYMSNMVETSLTYLDEYSLEKFKKFIPKVLEINKVSFGSQSHPIMCLCHGDYRANNIMLREIDGELEVIPIDYQFLHYGSPFNDLYYYIVTATDREFRRKHLDDLKNHYFDTMDKFMKYFDMRVEDIFTRKEFDRLFNENLLTALSLATWTLQILLVDENDVVDIVKTNITEHKFGRSDEAKWRFQEFVNEFIEWGLL